MGTMNKPIRGWPKEVEMMKADPKKLIDMVRKEIPGKEIMEELGIQTKASLKKMYYDALVEAGKIKDIMTERKWKKAKGPRKRPVTIGKRGTILLSKPLLVEQLGFKEGDKFTVVKRKDSMVLKKQ
ncbi:MAG: hypothetical protein ACFFCW_16330 [Candidatus Hodarchaeota archaeon]